MGYISREKLHQLADSLLKSGYGDYLKNIAGEG
jgi:hypothetical protein